MNVGSKGFIPVCEAYGVVGVFKLIVDFLIFEIHHVVLYITLEFHALKVRGMYPAAKGKMESTIFGCPEFVCLSPESPTSRPRSALDKVNQVRRRSISIRMALQHGFV